MGECIVSLFQFVFSYILRSSRAQVQDEERVSGGYAVCAVQVVHVGNNDDDKGAVVFKQVWSPS